MFKLAPSILSADFGNLARDIKAIEAAGADWVHIDMMDGMFVPNISFGFPVMKSIRPVTNLVFDAHLMVEEPGRYIEECKVAGADLICVHAEACKHLNRTVMQIKESGLKVGVALNPATPLSVLEYVLGYLDMVLIMTVNPGFGGQSFIENGVRKIKEIRQMANEKGLMNLDIEVDGGVTPQNVATLIEAGANVFVAGSAVFKGDIEKNIADFKAVFAKYEELK
ncbi:MAG: ribulose-phosphate 3-epimerase [Firmicutes bacterium]|uniref:Ribulose-phosphate 3-epimerase n=1 Tax=Candidatus Scybalomonas excrementavium TaxID=2840943 RepID=A0A9D9HYU6_9FIRM|nr:ribulose-phosphate 3-epimerase [Candidatus Scybalomonas excrementavium]